MDKIFPTVNLKYEGPLFIYYFFVLCTVASTLRSCIHMFRKDSGANSIAGIKLKGDSGKNIVALIS